MSRAPFVALPSGWLARVPLLPAEATGSQTLPDPVLTEAVLLASRQTWSAASADGADGDEHLQVTWRGYEIRARRRPTPHGAFAGVAPARIARGSCDLRLGPSHQARSYPSAKWLVGLATRLLDEPDVLARLRFTTSNLLTRRGGRLEMEQGGGVERVTIRATEAVILVLDTCRGGATLGEMIVAVTGRWASVGESVVTGTVADLVRHGFLLADLLPADVTVDPLAHLLDKLPAAHPVRSGLSQLRGLLAKVDGYPPGDPARPAELAVARSLADATLFTERALSVDVAADAHITVPAVLADEAAKAAGVLWRVSASQDPSSSYHGKFLHRYGSHRLVPLLEVVDPAVGLGLDFDGEDDAEHDPPGRTAVLAELLGTARGGIEVVLDEDAIIALTHDDVLPPSRTAEIYVRVLATSEADLAAGRLHLAVCPISSQDAGSTAGRFTGLIPRAADDAAESSALVVELVVQPAMPEGFSLAPPTGHAAVRLPVGVAPRDGDLAVDDLMVFSTGDQLVLWSVSRHRQVIPVLYSRLSPSRLPRLGRFLYLLGHAGTRRWRTWSWGPLRHLPFQPRVRYQRTVLCPARWVLPPALITAAQHRSDWDNAVHAWRSVAGIPAPPPIVVLDSGDRQLPLNLLRTDDRELLRRHVRRGVRAVTELPGGTHAVQAVVCGPCGRHVLELVIPLMRNTIGPRPVPPPRSPARRGGLGRYLPGGEWLSLAIRGPVHCHDQLVTELGTRVQDLECYFDHWYWLRYSTEAHGPHIRARFHGDPAALGGCLLPVLSDWCADMVAQRLSGGLSVEPYDQEIERYGGAKAIHAAEQVFATDSAFVLQALAATADGDQRLVLAAQSAASIAHTVALGDPASVRRPKLDRAARHRLNQLRTQVHSTRTVDDTPEALTLGAAWLARHQALIAYRDTLDPTHRGRCGDSIIHMHANRLLGSTDTERIARALAMDLLCSTSAP